MSSRETREVQFGSQRTPLQPGQESHLARARYLSELALLECTHHTTGTSNTLASTDQVAAWRHETGLTHEATFEQRLFSEGISKTRFGILISDQSIGKSISVTDDWSEILQEIFACADEASDQEKREVVALADPYPFAAACWSFLLWARRRYRQCWDSLLQKAGGSTFNTASLNSQLLSHLASQLSMQTSRTFALELNVARLKEELIGETGEQRFQSFMNKYADKTDRLKTLFEEYPVLARLLTVQANNWVAASMEALERFCQDYTEIEQRFGSDLGKLHGVEAGIADAHRKGRSTLIFVFTSGKRLLYKPRSLAVSEHFYQLVEFLNDVGLHPLLPTLAVIDRGSYGWEEYAEAVPCSSIAEVQRFYQRQGAYLALLYLLGAADFHRENVIAGGEYPYLVDLEVLFSSKSDRREQEVGERTATDIAYDQLVGSVLGTGLLPFLLGGGHGKAATELSGLGGSGEQATPTGVLRWKHQKTDAASLKRDYTTIGDAANRPTIHNSATFVEDFQEELASGFEQAYKMLEINRDRVGALLPRFENDTIRHVLRPTYIYALLLEGGRHPDFLRDGRDRDRLMDRLWAGVSEAPDLARVAPSEKQDLLAGDIPYFYSRPCSLSLWDSRNREIPYFFEISGTATVQRRLDALCTEDLEFQKRLIATSLGIGGSLHNAEQRRAARTEHQLPRPNGSQETQSKEAPKTSNLAAQEFMEAAVDIGKRLEETAIWSGDGTEATWLSISATGQNQWIIGPADEGLYGGLSGIALFLAYLAQLSGESRYFYLAKGAASSLEKLCRQDNVPVFLSAFQGRSSTIYAFTHLAKLFGEERLLHVAVEQVAALSEQVVSDESLDVLDGSAGALVALLRLYQQTGTPLAREVAIACGEHLLARSQRTTSGCGWKVPASEKPLAGFSHGAAGISWALTELYRDTGREEFKEAALEAMRFERSVYLPASGNWLDLRAEEDAGVRSPTHWCNGAPGIAISRLLCEGTIPYEHLRGEADAALETTLREGFGEWSHCLCHGDFGNVEPLLLGAELRGDSRLAIEAEQKGIQALQTARAEGRWRSGLSNGKETPGLMLGIAGVGFGLLRLADRHSVPSPLYLAPAPHHLEDDIVSSQAPSK